MTVAVAFEVKVEECWLRLCALPAGQSVPVWLVPANRCLSLKRPVDRAVRVGDTWSRDAKLADFRAACFAALDGAIA
jgi:hypothetical protein